MKVLLYMLFFLATSVSTSYITPSTPFTRLTRHQHTSECLKVVLLLICKEPHAHTPDCYNKVSILACQQALPHTTTTPSTSNNNTDYGPQILSTFFQTIVPGFLGMIVGAEAQDNQTVAQSLGVMAQGVGTIIDLGTRAKKINPHFSLEKILNESVAILKKRAMSL